MSEDRIVVTGARQFDTIFETMKVMIKNVIKFGLHCDVQWQLPVPCYPFILIIVIIINNSIIIVVTTTTTIVIIICIVGSISITVIFG